ncbi:CDP-alcohol phosphatidyltransferase family protein [Rhizohabitans arisaemae]|uniref:CDP-alcohol phosphatidyltransferase family protein n=1 Tax=Rhizohabitans arisaemae TaxID=2720610 RepID=UPI0024B1BC73|nr:CDP-alcohol phosphatidyltransferase family protein [Rhizohabitans arisaemae]
MTASAPPTAERPATVAVVLATAPATGLRPGHPADGSDSVFERLARQLAAAGRELRAVTRSARTPEDPAASRHLTASGNLADDLRAIAALARTVDGPLVVVPGDVVAHDEALALLISHPARATGALVSYETPDTLHTPVRVEYGRIVAAGTSFHRVVEANAGFRGVLQVSKADLEVFADSAETLALLLDSGRLGELGSSEATSLLLVGLVRSGVRVNAVDIRVLHCDRVADQEGMDHAISRLARVDEEKVRLDSAVKGDDGFFTTYFVSSWSRHLVRFCARLGLTPNAVTGISVGFAALAALWFAEGTRTGLVVGAFLLYFSFVLDCVDGQLARYTRRFSPLGAWLDATFDRVKEYMAYFGLAVGYAEGDIWRLAVAALVLQSVRHMVDFSYAGAQPATAQSVPPRPFDLPEDPLQTPVATADGTASATSAARGGSVVTISRRFDRNSALRWFKKIVVLPIGERMALICLAAALFDARVTFLALIVWGGLAACYMLAGRILRSLKR